MFASRVCVCERVCVCPCSLQALCNHLGYGVKTGLPYIVSSRAPATPAAVEAEKHIMKWQVRVSVCLCVCVSWMRIERPGTLCYPTYSGYAAQSEAESPRVCVSVRVCVSMCM